MFTKNACAEILSKKNELKTLVLRYQKLKSLFYQGILNLFNINCWYQWGPLGLGVDFTGGRKTGEPGETPSKHGRDQLQQFYSHEFWYQWGPLGLGVDFTEGGKPENPGEKPSKHGRDQLQQLYSHEFHVFLRINTWLQTFFINGDFCMETRLACFLVSEYLFPTTKLTWYHFLHFFF